MKKLSELAGWVIDANIDLSGPADLNGYVLFLSKGNKKDYLIMRIAEDESGELFYSPSSKTILENRSYGLYNMESKSLTSFGKLCVEYNMFTYDEIVALEEKRLRLNKDVQLAFLERKIKIFERWSLEMPDIMKKYETLKNS